MLNSDVFLDNDFKKQIIISRLSDLNVINVYCFEDIYNHSIYFRIFYKYRDIVLAKHVCFPVSKVTISDLSYDFIERACRRAIKEYNNYIKDALFEKSFKTHPHLWYGSDFVLNFVSTQKELYVPLGCFARYKGDFDSFTKSLIDKYIDSDCSAVDIIYNVLRDLDISQDLLLSSINKNFTLSYQNI